MSDWRDPGVYRVITVQEAEQAKEALLEPLLLFSKQCHERYQKEVDPNFTVNHYAGLCGLIDRAAVVFWKADLWSAAASGGPHFVGRTPDASKINPKVQLWILDRDFILSEQQAQDMRLGPNRVLTAILIIGNLKLLAAEYAPQNEVSDNTMAIASFYIPGIKNFRFVDGPNGQRAMISPLSLEEMVPTWRVRRFNGDDPVRDNAEASLLAMIDFMNQEYVSVARHEPSRQVKRALIRKGKTWPDIRHVVLRRAVTLPEREISHEKSIEWSCSWIVQGHWRKQWYPSQQTHHPRFIAEHLKGDTEKPLKPRTKTVYSVER